MLLTAQKIKIKKEWEGGTQRKRWNIQPRKQLPCNSEADCTALSYGWGRKLSRHGFKSSIKHFWLSSAAYLSHFITKQNEDQHIKDDLQDGRFLLEIHEQHVGEEQQENDVEDNIPGEDYKGRGEERHIIQEELLTLLHGFFPEEKKREKVSKHSFYAW